MGVPKTGKSLNSRQKKRKEKDTNMIRLRKKYDNFKVFLRENNRFEDAFWVLDKMPKMNCISSANN